MLTYADVCNMQHRMNIHFTTDADAHDDIKFNLPDVQVLS